MAISSGNPPRADESPENRLPGENTSVPATPLSSKTLGGRQFWADVRFLQGWRIQKNVVTGHFRLLDANDRRHASGTLDECNQKLDELARELSLQPAAGKVVVLIHGLIRSSKSFHGMAAALTAEGYTVVRFDYPSTRVSIEQSAAYLHSVLESLGEDVTTIDVVAHSMGGIVLRSFLQHHEEPRLHRAVMLGVPNRGAEIADRFRTNSLFRAVYGPAGTQLASGADGIVNQLPTPQFEFGIIAGGRGTSKGYNPLLPGDNDTTVTVTSTRLPGAADFLLVPVLHSFLMAVDEPVRATLHFLEHGRFRPDVPAAPINAEQTN